MSPVSERVLLTDAPRGEHSLYGSRRPGVPSGRPTGAYPRDWLLEDPPQLIWQAAGQRPEALDYGVRVGTYASEVEFFREELFRRSILRQGWGAG